MTTGNATDSGGRELIDFAIIGAQKSASTFVQRALGDHPEIRIAKGEPWVFENPYYSPDAVREFFEKLRGEASDGQLVGFKRPDALGIEPITARLAAAAPRAKLIVVLRDPVARALSGYFHYMRYDTLPLLEVGEGMRRILDGELTDFHHAPKVLEYGLYGKHLARYFGQFAREQMLVLLQEDIARDGTAELRKVYRFLGIDENFVSPKLGSRPQSVVYSMPRLRFLRLRSPMVFRWNADKTRFAYRRFSRPVWYLFEAIDRLFLAPVFKNRKPSLDAELKERLRQYYADDIAQAAELTGLDLSGWLAETPTKPLPAKEQATDRRG